MHILLFFLQDVGFDINMQRRNRDATAALLQKANCQLRGEKIAKPEDELNVSPFSFRKLFC